jgi:hypothetical protein
MRKDMKDLLVNTGRRGGGGKAEHSRRARFKRMDDDEVPTRISTARHRQFGWDAKELGDRLNPLWGFLEERCGRQWDEVYSEICQFADPRTTRGYHLRQHVWNFVVPNNYDVGHRRRYGPFFVHTDGTLQMEAPYVRQPRRKWNGKDNPKWYIDTDHYWEKIKGFWFYFEITRWTVPNSIEELVEVDGELQIIRRQLRDIKKTKITKHQVSGETQKELDTLWQASVQ